MTFARLVPASYREVVAVDRVPTLLWAYFVSYLGDSMSAVTIAWLAIEIAPADSRSLLVGASVAAYALPGVVGAFALARFMRRRSSRLLVVSDCALRAVLLGLIALLRAYNVLSPATYVGLLAASSLMFAWGLAGRYTVLTQLVHPEAALAANALHTAISSATIVVGPGLAGLLVALWGAGPLIGLDGASYALLAIVVWRSKPSAETTARLAAAALEASESGRALGGISLMRRHGIIGIVLLTWVFYLLYGPIEVALPVHVSQELHHGAGLLGLYWALFGAGAAIGSLSSGLLRRFPIWPTSLVIVALWGLCLVPFWFSAPVIVTMLFFGLGGLVYGPFVPLTYGLIQDRVAPHLQATVMAARGAVLTVAAPVGTAFGGPITAALGARSTLAISGIATVAATVIIGAAGPLRQRWSHAPPQPSPP